MLSKMKIVSPQDSSWGKTISSYGSITASNFTPQVGDDRKVTFEGVTKINTDAYFYLPTGDTVREKPELIMGTRGLIGGGSIGLMQSEYRDYNTE